MRRQQSRHPRRRKSIDELHEDYETYSEDSLNQVESWYGDLKSSYSPEKVEALLGDERGGGHKWTEKVIDHAIAHIEALISATEAERSRESQRKFDESLTPFERGQIAGVAPSVLPSNITVVAVKNQFGNWSRRYRNEDTGRFVRFVEPEKVAHSKVDPRGLERKE